MKPEFLKSGEPARLIPVVADTSKENRVASVSLSMITQVPALASALFSSIGQRIGKRTTIATYTEVVLPNAGEKTSDRPDGLIVLTSGKQSWKALVEAKIGNQKLNDDQIRRYIELAKLNDIDAVISISNEFVARADQHPLAIPKNLLRKVSLFHWPWMWIKTEAELLQIQEVVSDSEQKYLLNEFVRFLVHPSTGIEGFTQMNKEWREVVQSATQNASLKRTDDGVEGTVASWHQEQRDLCLLMAREVGQAVDLRLPKKYRDDPNLWLREDCARLVETWTLKCSLSVPNTVGDIEVVADLSRRSLTCSVRLQAPKDRKSTKARVNWLTRQLAKSTGENVLVRAIWPSRSRTTDATLLALRDDPVLIQTDNPKITPIAFEVAQVTDSLGRFSGSRVFIEEVEKLVPKFYEDVVQHLKQWLPGPPKPVSAKKMDEDQTGDLGAINEAPLVPNNADVSFSYLSEESE